MKRYRWEAELIVDIPREAETGFFQGLEDAISAYVVNWSRRNAWKTGDLTAEVHEVPVAALGEIEWKSSASSRGARQPLTEVC